MLCEMDRQLLPRIANIAAEFAGLILGALWRLVPAFFNQSPDLIDFVVRILTIITAGLCISRFLA